MDLDTPNEVKALALSADRAWLLDRLREGQRMLDTPYNELLRGSSFDFENKRLCGRHGFTLQWKLRRQPDQPIGYDNQQTSIGVVMLCKKDGIQQENDAVRTMTLKQFWQEERANRQRSKWFQGRFWVINNHGVAVDVAIKSFGFYNQLLYINGSTINHCTGHTCNTVSQMKKAIESILDNASAPEKTAKPQQA